jgi:hypothetical protein
MKKEVIKEKSFNNRLLYTFILLGIVFSLTLGVNAFGTSTPSTFGHSVGELDFTGGFNVPSGNVGIGTTSPSSKLEIYDGYLTINSPGLGWGTNQRIVSNGPLSFMPDSDNTEDPFIYMLNPSASSTITFNTVTGDVTANAFIYSSDKRLKENIKPLTNSLDKINQLEGVSFNWKDTGRPSIGLIAQDVEKVVPEIVSTNSEGFKGVEYGNLVALLIQGIKEQQKEIDNLQKQIDELKAKER